jgi:hypothetical protein
MTENQTPEPEQIDPELESPEDTEHEDDPVEENEDTPGEFDRDRVLSKLKKLNSENRNLRQQKKDAEREAEEHRGKSERVQALEAVNARYEALAEHDLPLRLAKFITATEPEQILEQAEELLSLGSPKAPPQDQPKERLAQRRQSPPADELADIDKFAESAFRR